MAQTLAKREPAEYKTIKRAEIAAKKQRRVHQNQPAHNWPQRTKRILVETRKCAITDSPSCDIILEDGKSAIKVSCRCDDGSDDSIASCAIAEKILIQGIGRINKVDPLQCKLRKRRIPKPKNSLFIVFGCSRNSCKIDIRETGFMNISFLVVDDELEAESILIGHPVLQHISIDTKTLLDENRGSHDGTDCSLFGNPTIPKKGGFVSRIIVACLEIRSLLQPTTTVRECTTSSPARKKTRSRTRVY